MNILTTTNDFKDQYNKHKHEFVENQMPSFHNLLWQVIVNERFADQTVAFTAVLRNGRTEIGIAEKDEYGYIPTSVGFNDGIDYKTANDICYDLNEAIFGLNHKASSIIVMTSMREDKKREMKKQLASMP